MASCFSTAVLLVLCSPALVAQPHPSEFYIVSVGFSDAIPGGHDSVLEIKSEGPDLLVRYIRAMDAKSYCGRATRILSTAARLANTSIAAITGGLNLCSLDQAAVDRAVRAYPERQAFAAFAGDRFSLVATCKSQTNVLILPYHWTVALDRMRRTHPQIANLWQLEHTVGSRAFGVFPQIDIIPPQMATRLQPADQDTLAELKSGRFDAGLRAIAPRSFADDVAALRTGPDDSEFKVALVNSGDLHFERYVDPEYPPLAKQARITGTVELELDFDGSGQVTSATSVSGHTILANAAIAVAKLWHLTPGPGAKSKARVQLEFAFRCP